MVKSCYGLLERSMLIYFAGNKCALSRNGVFCRHKTTCSTREAVKRNMLKAFFLLGRNTC